MRRVLCLWFPLLPIERIERRKAKLREVPFALIAESANRLLVHAANACARRGGVRAGLALADARAICPPLLTRPAAPLADAKLIEALARLMERFSPMVAIDGGDGIFLDVTGVAHLFGGETAMLGTLAGWIERLGFTVRLALADTPGTAWALAHYGGACTLIEPGANAVALAPLPVAALRIGEEVAELSQRLGLTTIGALYPLPRRTLAARFGLAAMTRLEQALGEQDEPLPFRRFEAPLRETLAFAEPIARTEDVEGAFAIVIERLCARLERDGKGVRLARLAFERVDNTRQSFAIATARPSRSPRALMRLVRDRLDGLDAGFGIERVFVEAERCEPLPAEQGEALGAQDLDDGELVASELVANELVDRLVNRFGHERVLCFASAESHLPERTYAVFSAAAPSPASAWIAPPVPRPARLLSRPEPVAESAESGLPSAIKWRGRRLSVTPLAGPERIEPEWWHDDPAWRTGARDYWWVRSACGLQLWLFRTRDEACGARSRWFLHGLGG
jgi:protein ImuB